jgi:isopentenyl diphosphate isomerase/L-lactate dehydrogenase-like FMN-dependent dehydrogenase
MVFDYLDAGADDEISLRRGKDAYSELEMHYKVLAGIKPPLDLRTKIFGCDVSLPFFG